jgi:hypothetical protein
MLLNYINHLNTKKNKNLKNMKKITQIIQKRIQILSLVSMLPSVYKICNIKQIIILFILVLCSFILTTGYIDNIQNNVLKSIIFYSTMAYFLFLIFNIIVRIFNIFFRMIPYFLSQSNIVLNRQVIIVYYIYNFICLVLSLLLGYKIIFFLFQFDNGILDYILIYIFFVSILGSLLYIDYISDLEIVVIDIKLNRLMYLLFFGNICILMLPIFGVVNIKLVTDILKEKYLLNLYYFHSHLAPDISENQSNIALIPNSDIPHTSLMESGDNPQEIVRGRRLTRGENNNPNVVIIPEIPSSEMTSRDLDFRLGHLKPVPDKLKNHYFLSDQWNFAAKIFPELYQKQVSLLKHPTMNLTDSEIFEEMKSFLKWLEKNPKISVKKIQEIQINEELQISHYERYSRQFDMNGGQYKRPYPVFCNYSKKLLPNSSRFPVLPTIYEEKLENEDMQDSLRKVDRKD